MSLRQRGHTIKPNLRKLFYHLDGKTSRRETNEKDVAATGTLHDRESALPQGIIALLWFRPTFTANDTRIPFAKEEGRLQGDNDG